MGKKLSFKESKFLIMLGIPSLGSALTYTLVTTYLPYFIERLSNAAVTGILIGAEGIFALSIPPLVGLWSDAISTPLGARLPFFFAGVFVTCIALFLIPFGTHNLFLVAITLFLFFVGYFTMFEAYYALYPDLVPLSERGRSQGIMGGFRSIGMLIALMASGFLINLWEPLPFFLYALVLVLVSFILYYTVRKKIKIMKERRPIDWYDEWKLIQQSKKIRLWIVANTCWETAVSVLRVFIVLYFTKGIGLTLNQSSAALGLVGLSAIVAAPIAGFLADKYGHRPVILGSVLFFAIGLIPPIFTANRHFLVGILPVAFSAVILMTLPFSMLMAYLPKNKQHGSGAALFGICQGIAVLVGPFLAGIAVELSKNVPFLVFKETGGYSAIYIVASLFLFLSVPFVSHLFKIVAEESLKRHGSTKRD